MLLLESISNIFERLLRTLDNEQALACLGMSAEVDTLCSPSTRANTCTSNANRVAASVSSHSSPHRSRTAHRTHSRRASRDLEQHHSVTHSEGEWSAAPNNSTSRASTDVSEHSRNLHSPVLDARKAK